MESLIYGLELQQGSPILALLCWILVGAIYCRERKIRQKPEQQALEIPMLVALVFISNNMCHFILFFVLFVPYCVSKVITLSSKFMEKYARKTT